MATPTQYYVDPSAGNDTTGDGTSDATAWATLKYAIETGITRDATNGDQVNVKSSATDAYSTGDPAIAISSYATDAAATAPLIIRGYDSVADDGGVGVVTFTGRMLFNDTVFDYGTIIDMDLSGGNASGFFELDRYTTVIRCTMEQTSTGRCALADSIGSSILFCTLLTGTTGSLNILTQVPIFVFGCFIKATASGSRGISGANVFMNNIVHLNSTAATYCGLYNCATDARIFNNVIFNSAAGAGAGIGISNSRGTIANNYIEGFSGTGGYPVLATGSNSIAIAGNRWHNCSNGISTGDCNFVFDNSLMGSSGLTDVGAGDYTPLSGLIDAAMPSTFNDGGQDANINIGAVQEAASAGGSGGIVGMAMRGGRQK